MIRSNKNLASRLKYRVNIEQPVLTTDNAGGYVQSWNRYAEVWADVIPANANEKFVSEQVKPTKRTVFVMRFLEGVSEGMRINFESKKFNILSVLNPYEENILLEISAEEVSA